MTSSTNRSGPDSTVAACPRRPSQLRTLFALHVLQPSMLLTRHRWNGQLVTSSPLVCVVRCLPAYICHPTSRLERLEAFFEFDLGCGPFIGPEVLTFACPVTCHRIRQALGEIESGFSAMGHAAATPLPIRFHSLVRLTSPKSRLHPSGHRSPSTAAWRR